MTGHAGVGHAIQKTDDDAAAPASEEQLFSFLDTLGIRHETHRHPAVFTVAEAQALRGNLAGGHTKNLFLKDKKDNYFLVSLEDTAEVDLKTLHKVIGAASRLSFGKPDKLMDYLGVVPGSVTLMGTFNDRDHHVRVIIDEALLGNDVVNVHPLTNSATTSIGRDDLLRFLEATGHRPSVLKLSA
jgi:Ala-tRNA(Pro) deacylase